MQESDAPPVAGHCCFFGRTRYACWFIYQCCSCRHYFAILLNCAGRPVHSDRRGKRALHRTVFVVTWVAWLKYTGLANVCDSVGRCSLTLFQKVPDCLAPRPFVAALP
jgi:hypothetical protein